MDNLNTELQVKGGTPERIPVENVELIEKPETLRASSSRSEQTDKNLKDLDQHKNNSRGQDAPANVVDKSKNITELHPIENPRDNITSLADQKEEKFIEEVKAAHDHAF